MEQKVRALADYSPHDDPVILVDDRGHTHFLAMLERLKEEPSVRNLISRLTIIAFGVSASDLPSTNLCCLFALPDWKHLPRVLDRIGVLPQRESEKS
jgi:hypothetical protein